MPYTERPKHYLLAVVSRKIGERATAECKGREEVRVKAAEIARELGGDCNVFVYLRDSDTVHKSGQFRDNTPNITDF